MLALGLGHECHFHSERWASTPRLTLGSVRSPLEAKLSAQAKALFNPTSFSNSNDLTEYNNTTLAVNRNSDCKFRWVAGPARLALC